MLFYYRNATLELLSDGGKRNSRSSQTSSRVTEFDNYLALSVEQDGQAMSEVSSFHTESLYSQHDSLQVSVSVPSQLSSEVVSYSLFLII